MIAARTAAVAVLVRIYEITREWSTWVWLCEACAARRAQGTRPDRKDAWKVGRPKLAPPRLVRIIDGACPVDYHDRRPLVCLDCRANEGIV